MLINLHRLQHHSEGKNGEGGIEREKEMAFISTPHASLFCSIQLFALLILHTFFDPFFCAGEFWGIFLLGMQSTEQQIWIVIDALLLLRVNNW